MCGICGIYLFRTGRRPDEELLHRMTHAMQHRGPDDWGRYVGERVGMGMRRLSIIDVLGGSQPVRNEDGTVRIVFNGEIYNYAELRRELESRGHCFYSRSDTEVIIHSYEEWGVDCPLHLNGIFAFSIWDERQNRLLLARDHFGVKPLYYHQDDTRLLWASEIKALLCDPAIPRAVDREALDLYLTFRFVPSPHTLFNSIRKLPPGHRLIAAEGSIRVERYWSPQPKVEARLSEDGWVQLLQERLEAAVRRQMISDVPIGALLSGGIDSAVVVALMQQYSDHPVRTFSVGFSGEGEESELEDARRTAEILGTEHHEIELSSIDYRTCLEDAAWRLEEPICTTSALPMFFVCMLARDYVPVVLTGQGADEPLGGYPRYYGERYGHLYRLLPGFVRDGLVKPMIEALPRRERIKRAVRCLGISDITARFLRTYSVFDSQMKKDLWRPELNPGADARLADQIVNYWRQEVSHLPPMMQIAHVDARLGLADDLLLYGDKMSMATSVEARVPFLDLSFMAAAEALPPSLRIKGRTLKYIHRKVVAKWLPEEIISRPKRGFQTPVDRWLRAELTGYVRKTLLSSASASTSYFNPAAIERLIKDHVSGRQDNCRQLFGLLAFELWHRRFIDEFRAEEAPSRAVSLCCGYTTVSAEPSGGEIPANGSSGDDCLYGRLARSWQSCGHVSE